MLFAKINKLNFTIPAATTMKTVKNAKSVRFNFN